MAREWNPSHQHNQNRFSNGHDRDRFNGNRNVSHVSRPQQGFQLRQANNNERWMIDHSLVIKCERMNDFEVKLTSILGCYGIDYIEKYDDV